MLPYHGWDCNSNCALSVFTPLMFSYLADHLRMLDSVVREHLCHVAGVNIELTRLCAFSRTVSDKVVKRLETDGMNCVCGNDGDFSFVSQGKAHQCFAMKIFRALRHMHCNSILALLAMARFADFG